MQARERLVGELAELDRLDPGSHVCCVVDSAARFEEMASRCLAEGARRGEKLFRFGPQARLESVSGDPSVTVVDPGVAFLADGPVDPAVMFAVFRRETAAARSAGYRGLRLVADMDWLLARRPSGPELAAFELLLDEVVTELGATVVCAYRTEHFDDATIAELVAVHPVTVGPAPAELGFRLWNVAPAEWELTGEIDAFNAEPFGRALTAAASGVKALRLRGAGLRFMAAAGIGAVIQVALARQDLRLVIEDVNATVQRCWSLLDLERALPGVELLPAPADGASPVEAR